MKRIILDGGAQHARDADLYLSASARRRARSVADVRVVSRLRGHRMGSQAADPPPDRYRAPPPRLQVLIVIDMQRDYDTNANVKLYGSVRSPYANDIGQFVPAINAIRRARSWDRVVFTLDWLPAAMLSGRTPFCEADSAGAALLDGLDVDASLDVCFRKDSDDSFCDTGGIPE